MAYKSEVSKLLHRRKSVLCQSESYSFGNESNNLPSRAWLEHLSIQRPPHSCDPRREIIIGEVIQNPDDDIYRTALTIN